MHITRYFGSIIKTMALALLPLALSLSVSIGKANNTTYTLHAPIIYVCPNPNDLASAVAISRNGRVYVLPEDKSPIRCVTRFAMLTDNLSPSLDVEVGRQHYCKLIRANLEHMLETKPISKELMNDIERYGFDIFDFKVFGGRIAHVAVATSKPGGLGYEFAMLVGEAAAKAVGARLEVVFVSYTAPDIPHMMDELAKRLSDFVRMSLEKGVTIAIGYDGYVPVVVVYKKAVDLVGGVQNLADLIAENLPEGGWALLILKEKPHRLYIQPKQLNETVEETASNATGAGQATSGRIDRNNMALDEMRVEAPSASKVNNATTMVSTAFSAVTSVKEEVREQLRVKSVRYAYGEGDAETPTVMVFASVTFALVIVLALLLWRHRR